MMVERLRVEGKSAAQVKASKSRIKSQRQKWRAKFRFPANSLYSNT